MILMGLQLLHVYQFPSRRIFRIFKKPESYTTLGAFLIGVTFGAITVGRAAPMLLIVLTYIALYQTPVAGFTTMLIFSAGFMVPLIVVSTAGGVAGQKVRELVKVSGKATDRVIGVLILLIGLYFLYMAAI